MPTYQALSDLVTIEASLVGTNPQSASFAVPMIAWEFSFAGWGATRTMTFSGTRAQALADWVASGGSVGDAVYVAIYQMLSQRSAPSSFVVGRRDPIDGDWGTALDAIYAENGNWYAFCLADDRTPSGILEAGNWVTTKIALLFPETADADVYSQAGGNLHQHQPLLPAHIRRLDHRNRHFLLSAVLSELL